MSWKEALSWPDNPIVALEPEQDVVLLIEEVRPTKYKGKAGHLIDCTTLDGTGISLRGHRVLVNKISVNLSDEGNLFRIRAIGQVDDYFDYEVQRWEGTPEEFRSGSDYNEIRNSTEAIIAGLVEALPPRD